MTSMFTVEIARDFGGSAEQIFNAWTDPEIRKQFETPDGSGMRHENFARAEGETEVVLIENDGQEIGRMEMWVAKMERPTVMIAQGRGVFGGTVTMTMQNTFRLAAKPDGGCTFIGTSQMVVMGEQPTEADVEKGWADMLNRFETVLSRMNGI